ncbi:hypothetical protein GCM10018783_49670 [Streptomyces griseosporeus]|nr:hypothetical protein GCM10018783_49670 [Streptomyces griseosporeus]
MGFHRNVEHWVTCLLQGARRGTCHACFPTEPHPPRAPQGKQVSRTGTRRTRDAGPTEEHT